SNGGYWNGRVLSVKNGFCSMAGASCCVSDSACGVDLEQAASANTAARANNARCCIGISSTGNTESTGEYRKRRDLVTREPASYCCTAQPGGYRTAALNHPACRSPQRLPNRREPARAPIAGNANRPFSW